MRNASNSKARIAGLSLAVLLMFASTPARAASNNDLSLDAAALTQLEDRAEHAAAREQCFLYTELVHVYTQVAGKQMAAGEMEQASATLKRIQAFAARIHMGLAKDTKRLKNAEMLMHSTVRNLGEYMHHVSSDDKAVVESTLKQLDKVNDELLAQVFAH